MDVVVVLENSFMFAGDLMRRISQPVVCHFVRTDVRDVQQSGFSRREIFFRTRRAWLDAMFWWWTWCCIPA